MRIQVSFDHDGFTQQASEVIDWQFQSGMQNVVDYLAAKSRQRLSEETERDFDRPIKFTRSAFAYQRQPRRRTPSRPSSSSCPTKPATSA